MTADDGTAESIRAHFAATEFFYRWVWGTGDHFAMHAGFDESAKDHASAVLAMNGLLADAAGISEGDRVLDAGCGIGGSSFWLHAQRKAIPTGIDLCPRHIDAANKLASRLATGNLSFHVADYTGTPFDDESFDVFWAQESSCYAADKALLLSEAQRVLRRGGRIVIGDTFLSRGPSDEERVFSDRFAAGYALAPLATVESFSELLPKCGFRIRYLRDITPFVGNASRRMHRAGKLLGPARFVLRLLGRTSRLRAKAIDAAIAQRTAREIGLGIYVVIAAEKV